MQRNGMRCNVAVESNTPWYCIGIEIDNDTGFQSVAADFLFRVIDARNSKPHAPFYLFRIFSVQSTLTTAIKVVKDFLRAVIKIAGAGKNLEISFQRGLCSVSF
jgi:hypothetical protein